LKIEFDEEQPIGNLIYELQERGANINDGFEARIMVKQVHGSEMGTLIVESVHIGDRRQYCLSCGVLLDDDNNHSAGECNFCHEINKDD
jgi:hypothetical protein